MSYSLFNATEKMPEGLDDFTKKFTIPGGRDQVIYPGVIEALMILAGSKGRRGDVKFTKLVNSYKMTITCPPDAIGHIYRYVICVSNDLSDIRGRVLNDTTKTERPMNLTITGSWPVFTMFIWMMYGNTKNESFSNLMTKLSDADATKILSDTEYPGEFAQISYDVYAGTMKGNFPRIPASGRLKGLKPEEADEKEDTSETADSFSDDAFDYSLHSSIPEEYQHLIPEIPDWYVMPKWVKQISKMVKLSPDLRNFYLTGEAGTGKTQGAQAIAALLHLPYGKLTCNEDFEIFDIFGQLLPVTDGSDLKDKLSGITDDDMLMNPEKVAEAVGSKSAELKDILIAASKNGGEGYHYVKSDAVLAYEYGFVCEIQEAKVVRKAGTLVGMNNMLECGINKSITLPTGEIIRKHPNCIFIFTSNESYEGCRTLNQSVLSRMNLEMHIDLPDAETMADRVMKKTGFRDMSYMSRMVKLIRDIHEYCEKQDITDGVCGMRELETWAQVVNTRVSLGDELNDALVKECGEWAVLNKTSQTRENIEEIRTAKWDAAF